jgi:Family of unknown function (DUF5335)
MHSHEIARQDWRKTLDSVSRLHDGQLVTVEVDAPAFGAHTEVVELPLVGISLETREPSEAIAIAMGGGGDGHITHLIDRPVRLFVDRSAADTDSGIEVESADHTRTIVRFRLDLKDPTIAG